MSGDKERSDKCGGVFSLVPVILGAGLGMMFLSLEGHLKHQNFDDFALGEGTSSVFAEVEGQPVHGRYLDSIPACVEAWQGRGPRPVVLWLGNSQLHGINQADAGAVPAPGKLFATLAETGKDLLTFSQPNANLQEHYLLLAYLSERLTVQALLLPVVFDDLRETGIRSELRGAFDDQAAVRRLAKSEVGRQILLQYQDGANPTSGGDDLNGLRETVQERVEKRLNDWLEGRWQLWANRPQLRGKAFTDLYHLRNRAFRISAQSKRKMISGSYSANMAALSAILDECARSGISAFLYIVPLRQDVSPPYVEEEYTQFKKDVAMIAEQGGAELWNLELLVPGPYWGMMKDVRGKGAGFDFMHFQEEGHAMLAKAIGEKLSSALQAAP